MRVTSTSRKCLSRGEGRAPLPSSFALTFGSRCPRTPPRCSSSRLQRQISDSDEVIGGERKREHPVDQSCPSMSRLPHHADRLQPTEDLLHPLALPLAHLISGMACGATIDRAPTRRGVLSHVWSHPVLAHGRHKATRVESLVASQGASTATRNVFDQDECSIPFGGARGLRGAATDGKAISVFHDDVAQVGQLRFLATRLAIQPRLRVSRRLMRLVRPLLAPEINARITGIVSAVAIRRVLLLETLLTRPGLPQRAAPDQQLNEENTDPY